MATPRYDLDGAKGFPQVEPGSGAWLRCPVLQTVKLQDLRDAIDAKVKPFTDFDEETEFEKLQEFYENRLKAVPNLSRFLSDAGFFERVPAGAVLSMDKGIPQVGIKNGVELATLFEGETPGLWHRHVLNVVLDPSVDGGAGQMLSPPRQALIWVTLDVAIASALSAAWHYKWVAEGLTDVDFRRRPIEYVEEYNENSKEPLEFEVLYDLIVERDVAGKIFRKNPKKKGPTPSPGTPRHPAYPSGHSTYSAAASYVLACLFDGYKDPRPALKGLDWGTEFKKLAENIGVARFYGGVHWESDHTLGELVGAAVGKLVIAQLNKSGIPVRPIPEFDTPDAAKVEAAAKDFGTKCGNANNDFCQGVAAVELGVQQNIEVR